MEGLYTDTHIEVKEIEN